MGFSVKIPTYVTPVLSIADPYSMRQYVYLVRSNRAAKYRAYRGTIRFARSTSGLGPTNPEGGRVSYIFDYKNDRTLLRRRDPYLPTAK